MWFLVRWMVIAGLGIGIMVSNASARDLENTIYLDLKDGRVVIELRPDLAPNHVARIKELTRQGFYDGLKWHRVIDGFMIQGGGMDRDMNQKAARDPIKNEANNGLSNDMGTVAMARTGDPHSASAQFFINVGDNEFLNHSGETQQGWGYCVFGKIIDGMDTVNEIKGVATASHGGGGDVPKEPIEIMSATVITD